MDSGLLYDNDLKADFSGRGEFELYFPQSATVEPRLVWQLDLVGGALETDLRYMYLRRRRENGHFTMGRQPVSWSYGAMINLLDYGLGIEDLGEETITPGIDGLRWHRSLGGGRNLQLITSFPGLGSESEDLASKLDELGYGLRLRLPGSGYDLSFNLSYQPIKINKVDENGNDSDFEDDNLVRAGMTYNRDIGDLGSYGSVGYFHQQNTQEDDFMLQLGIDYSWIVGGYNGYGGRQVLLQAEYFRFLQQNFNAGQLAALQIGGGEAERNTTEVDATEEFNIFGGGDLLTVNLVTSLDYFTDLGVVMMMETEEQQAVLVPYYISDLGGGLELRVDSRVYGNREGDFNSGIAAGLTYYF
ncbi:hypothetical protein [Fuchsiella alkaliacetigena]|uniref:hypothetical protein n=1 Tax=Fuchsiella alkaliacetigena TaxID=957042 RepID=UPI00200B9A65|nr:hypothetical protein [Fuchsiella alkaliacetigena]MCK8824147.1 hypothetical protein [Fuchsiella alkaliacetigena]